MAAIGAMNLLKSITKERESEQAKLQVSIIYTEEMSVKCKLCVVLYLFGAIFTVYVMQ